MRTRLKEGKVVNEVGQAADVDDSFADSSSSAAGASFGTEIGRGV